jgi:hypothetical protein
LINLESLFHLGHPFRHRVSKWVKQAGVNQRYVTEE